MFIIIVNIDKLSYLLGSLGLNFEGWDIFSNNIIVCLRLKRREMPRWKSLFLWPRRFVAGKYIYFETDFPFDKKSTYLHFFFVI